MGSTGCYKTLIYPNFYVEKLILIQKIQRFMPVVKIIFRIEHKRNFNSVTSLSIICTNRLDKAFPRPKKHISDDLIAKPNCS